MIVNGFIHQYTNNYRNNYRNNDKYAKLPNGYRERLYAFSPTGLCSNLIGYNSYTILQIGSWLFCHGSPVTKTLKTYTTDMLNNYVSMYLIGIKTKDLEKHYHNITKSSQNSLLWNRDFGNTKITNGVETKLQNQLEDILKEYNTKNSKFQNRIINCKKATQKQGINSICNNRVWRCDVSMSKAFGDNKISKYRQPQVLEILNDVKTSVLI